MLDYKTLEDICSNPKILSEKKLGNIDLNKEIYNENTKTNQLPITMAVCREAKEVVKYFSENGADLNKINSSGNIPLGSICLYGNGGLSKAKILIDCGANINAKDKYGMTPLFHAVISRSYELVKYFIKCGADINETDLEGKAPLFYLCGEGTSIKILDYLKENGANINISDNAELTPLSIAIISENYFLANHLMELGADINYCVETGLLHYLLFAGKINSFKRVVSLGVDLNIKYNGETIGDLAIELGDFDILDFLVEKGLKFDNNSLNKSIIYSDIKMSEIILETGLDEGINEAKITETTVRYGNILALKQLKKYSVNLDISDKYGQTSLHISAISENIDMTKCLLEYGSDMYRKDIFGISPFDICSMMFDKDTMNMLKLHSGIKKNIDFSDDEDFFED